MKHPSTREEKRRFKKRRGAGGQKAEINKRSKKGEEVEKVTSDR